MLFMLKCPVFNAIENLFLQCILLDGPLAGQGICHTLCCNTLKCSQEFGYLYQHITCSESRREYVCIL